MVFSTGFGNRQTQPLLDARPNSVTRRPTPQTTNTASAMDKHPFSTFSSTSFSSTHVRPSASSFSPTRTPAQQHHKPRPFFPANEANHHQPHPFGHSNGLQGPPHHLSLRPRRARLTTSTLTPTQPTSSSATFSPPQIRASKRKMMSSPGASEYKADEKCHIRQLIGGVSAIKIKTPPPSPTPMMMKSNHHHRRRDVGSPIGISMLQTQSQARRSFLPPNTGPTQLCVHSPVNVPISQSSYLRKRYQLMEGRGGMLEGAGAEADTPQHKTPPRALVLNREPLSLNIPDTPITPAATAGNRVHKKGSGLLQGGSSTLWAQVVAPADFGSGGGGGGGTSGGTNGGDWVEDEDSSMQDEDANMEARDEMEMDSDSGLSNRRIAQLRSATFLEEHDECHPKLLVRRKKKRRTKPSL